ncbi:SpoIIE family protein phosphatase [Thermovenabulum gondwanense]|uniref:Stage II sporulation protein E n=1 Tax=Thermovenabulum gondwanense TaxID=520767 RepID=A0A162N4G5_9FIRM|nr:SpoIIE family protein phosphatase [Thermovenabulum gondwanense]KYO69287.1 Stage II sporulation protein E [Thermovenabulum gondwanense]
MINKKVFPPKEMELKKSNISLRELMLILIGFIMGHASLFNIYPFGLPFISSIILKDKNKAYLILPVFIGTFTGVKNVNFLWKYGLAYIIFTLLILTFKKEINIKKWLLPFLCSASIIMGGLLSFLWVAPSYYDIILLILETLLSYISVIILSEGLTFFYTLERGNVEKLIALTIISGSILKLIGNTVFFGVSIKNLIISAIIVFSAFARGTGEVFGYGVILSLLAYPSSLLPWALTFYSIAGCFASFLKKYGKIGVLAGFLIGYGIYHYYIGLRSVNFLNYQSLILILIATFLIPEAVIKKLENTLSLNEESSGDINILKDMINTQMIELANTLEEMGKIYKYPIRDGNLNPLEDSILKIKNRICRDCALFKACWDRDYKSTIADIFKLYTAKEVFLDGDLPRLFKVRCGKLEEIYRFIKMDKEKNELKKVLDAMVREISDISFEKVKHFASCLKMLAKKGIDENRYAEDLKEELSKEGINVENIIIADEGKGYSYYIIKRPCMGNRTCEVKIMPFFENAFIKGADMLKVDCPLRSGKEKCRIKIVPRSFLSVAVGYVNIPKEGASFSGDSATFFETVGGQYYMALSDGMGVGEKARNHSEKTLLIFENLIESGYGLEDAIRILNSAMQVYGSGGDSFSTLDITFIDLSSGMAEFVKAGAVSSFIKRKDKVESLRGSALPIGVMDGINPVRIRKKLMPQDMVIMVTDGVMDSIKSEGDKEEKFIKIIESIKTTNPQEFAEKILKKVLEGSEEKRDDMAILVGLVWERKN